MVALVGLGYVALTISYSWVWRHIPLLDLVALAGGFVLRAVAGGVAAPVGLSRWFVLVVTCVAIFVAAGKRLAETGPRAASPPPGRVECCVATREKGCGRVLALAGAGALFAYCVWAFELPDVDGRPLAALDRDPVRRVPAALRRRLSRPAWARHPRRSSPPIASLRSPASTWLLLFIMSVNAAG